MDLPWLDLPFTFLTLLLATRLAYDYYGDVAAAFAGGFSIQLFLFYCFARWYRHAIVGRAGAGAAGRRDDDPSPSSRQQGGAADADDDPPVLTPLLGGPDGLRASTLANRCFAVVFMVFVPLVIVVFERSQADVVAYVLCLANIIVMVVWLSPDSGAAASDAAKSFLRLSDDEDDGSTGGSAGPDEKCCVCLAGMREDQALRALPRCGHRFHDKCIGKWLKAHPTCPVCRATAVPPTQDGGGGDPHDDDIISPV
jgi:hypothetical protein